MKKQKMDFEQQIRFIKSKILELKATGEYSNLAIIFNEDFTKSKEILENILFYGLDDELAEKVINNVLEIIDDQLIEFDILDSALCDLYGICAGTDCKNYYKCKM